MIPWTTADVPISMFQLTKGLVLVCGLLSGVACGGGDNTSGYGADNADSDTGGSGGSDSAIGSGGTTQRLPLGAPCIPWSETQSDFSGFSSSYGIDLSVEYERCEGQLCLAHHFQGRVTCPYGQTQHDLTLPADHERRCRTMAPTTGDITPEPVEVAVAPQLVARRAEDVVHCSCRCAGPDPNAEYCTCPNGMECVDLVEDLGIGRNDLAGSYCINAGTTYDSNSASTSTCDMDGTTAETDCGNDRRNP